MTSTYGNLKCSGNYGGGMDEEKRITVRLPIELHERLATQAKRDRRSINSEIVHLLEVTLTDPSADTEAP
jgi:hypothetical protein